MSHTATCIPSGRAAAIARRRALSAGKAALPPATERVRNGERSASRAVSSQPAANGASQPTAHAVVAAVAAPGHSTVPLATVPLASRPDLLGRRLSMERRSRLAAGKGALGASHGGAGSKGSVVAAPGPSPGTFPGPSGSRPDLLGRRLSMERRSRLAAGKGALGSSPGSAASQAAAVAAPISHGSPPSARRGRALREGSQQLVQESAASTRGRQAVTGSRVGNGSDVTGTEAGASRPVSGTQCIAAAAGAAFRSGGPKVGHTRTRQGGVVSGSMVRSTVRITGDEAGGRIHITGEADQRPEDDLTERSADGAHVAAQFQRQVAPHAQSVFGTNLGRSSGRVGSRDRQRAAPLESTESGLSITGSAVGRTIRVTGDEPGACRVVTGDQYLSPARAQAECGGTGGGTAPAAQLGAMRRDPVSGAKVSVAETWGRQRVTGCNVEHDPRVTGDAAGACALLTGTPYQGASMTYCDPATVNTAAARLAPRTAPASAVTGNAPLNVQHVTGTARGATRSISGTPYGGESAPGPAELPDSPVAAVAARFSIRSPQRTAQLHATGAAASADASDPAARITGSFAIGHEKITGNLEFRFQPRHAAQDGARAAHTRLTGEGSIMGRRITNCSWGDHAAVTGTEGPTAAERNPSERNGNAKAQAFSGAARFKASAKPPEERKQLVTGLLGWSSKAAAKVTLSGGAQG
jgi:hypothetical protein